MWIQMKKALGVIFFTSWMICGCSLETVFDNPRSAAVTVITAIVAVTTAYVIGKGE